MWVNNNKSRGGGGGGGTMLTWGRSSLICRKLFVANPWDMLSIHTTWEDLHVMMFESYKVFTIGSKGGGGVMGARCSILATIDPYPYG